MDQVSLTLKPHLSLTLKPSTCCMLAEYKHIIFADGNPVLAANSCMLYHCFIKQCATYGTMRD